MPQGTVSPETAFGAPLDGDILVSPGSDGRDEYILQELPRTPQVALRSREAALDLAGRFARTQAVNVWLTDGCPPVLMRRHRPV